MRTPLRPALLIGVLILASSLLAQNEATTPRERYNQAVLRPAGARRAVLEPILKNATPGVRRDVLTLLVWEAGRDNRYVDAEPLARELAQMDPNNALALTALSSMHTPDARSASEALGYARRALRSARTFARPEGISDDEYEQMVRSVRAHSSHVVGELYLKRNDYISARKYLKESVALSPSNSQFAYTAALAFLDGKRPDASTGYWLLARAVNLSQGSSEGKTIAEYARKRYVDSGGTNDNWNQFLVSATVPAPPVDRNIPAVADSNSVPVPTVPAEAKEQVAVAPTIPSSAGTVESPSPVAGVAVATGRVDSRPDQKESSSPAASASQSATTTTETQTTSAQQQIPDREMNVGVAEVPRADVPTAIPNEQPHPTTVATGTPTATTTTEVASIHPGRTGLETRDEPPLSVPPLPPASRTELEPLPSRKPLRVYPVGAPVSLGIVIQASIASKQNRSSVVYTLSDMVRGLREQDEAFIESYGDKVSFGQDLTWNYELLEKAMDQIGTGTGTALLDAVGFAADHLRRISKNDNRVLLVVSDGNDSGGSTYSSDVVSLIKGSGARVVCIGIGVEDEANRGRLQELATLTGGQALFINGLGDFRSAAHQVASSLGVHFQE